MLHGGLSPGDDRRHRSELGIIYNIVRVVRSNGQVKKTHLMNAVNLNSSNAAKYLGKLVRRGILEEVRVGREIHYRLTSRGLVFSEILEIVVGMLSRFEEKRSACDALDKYILRGGVLVQKNVYLVSPSGVKYAVDYYFPESGAVVVTADGESEESLLHAFHRIVSMAVAMRDSIRKIIVVAPGHMAEVLGESLRSVLRGLPGLEEKVEVIADCNGTIIEKLALNGGRLGPHTAPHGPHGS